MITIELNTFVTGFVTCILAEVVILVAVAIRSHLKGKKKGG
jgi:hypothetical protein